MSRAQRGLANPAISLSKDPSVFKHALKDLSATHRPVKLHIHAVNVRFESLKRLEAVGGETVSAYTGKGGE